MPFIISPYLDNVHLCVSVNKQLGDLLSSQMMCHCEALSHSWEHCANVKFRIKNKGVIKLSVSGTKS